MPYAYRSRGASSQANLDDRRSSIKLYLSHTQHIGSRIIMQLVLFSFIQV
jgi:hypothetical protein